MPQRYVFLIAAALPEALRRHLASIVGSPGRPGALIGGNERWPDDGHLAGGLAGRPGRQPVKAMILASGGRWPARIVVIALHIAAIALLCRYQAPSLYEPSHRQVVTLRLLQPPDRKLVPAATHSPTIRSSAVPAPTKATAHVKADSPVIVMPIATTITEAESAMPATPPAENPGIDLRLTLPPSHALSSMAARNPALADPRGKTQRATVEGRIADATGGAGEWLEEKTSGNRLQVVGAMGNLRTVKRRGDTCMEIFTSRIEGIDPFNDKIAPRTVPMVGRPYQCK